MAVTYISNALGGTTTTTSFTITLPATEANDIIILEYTHRGTGNGTIGGTYDGPAFTEKHDQPYDSSAFSGKTLYSRATGNHTGQTVTGASLTNSCAAVITIYRGAKTTGDPLADATIVGEQNAAGNETQAQITTATDGAWVVLVVANSPDVAVSTQANTSPGTLTARAERLSTGGTDTSIAHASGEKATAGATGAFTWAQTNGAGGSWAYAIIPNVPPTVALNTPADVATGQSTTPDLLFTGTDADSDEIEYNVQVDTVNTFDSVTGTGNVYVMTWGAGGGAQGSNNNSLTQGRGGGGGAFAGKTVSASNATGYSIAVGAGGAGGAAGNPPGGGVNGGDSTFATTTVVAKGGNSGGNSGTGGLATDSTGDDKYNGGTGAAGNSIQSGGGGGGSGGSTAAGSNGSGATGGAGGTPDGGAGGNSSGPTGQVGTVPGGGGGAGDWQESGSAGADGKVVIRALLGVVTSATGGTKTSDGTYDYWTFTAGGTWTPTIGTPLLSKLSVTPDATFTGTGDPHPWPSGNQVTYTVQAGNILTASTVYYWRVRGTDPLGSNTYGAWATTRSFTTAAAGSSSNIVGYKTLLGAGF